MISKENTRFLGTGLWMRLLAVVFCLSYHAGALSAAPSVAVTGSGRAWSESVTLDLADLIPYGTSLGTVDPNFQKDGKQMFTGVPLVTLLSMAGLDNRYGLTVIGADQYVGYLTPGRAARGILAWAADGEPVSGLKGGPLKLMFPDGEGHASCFTWYVTGLVQGRPAPPDLAVSANGKTLNYSLPDLVAQSSPLPPHLVSIAQGCRNEFPEPVLAEPARAVPLSRLTGDLSRAESVSLVPYYGPMIRLKPEALAFEARIIVSFGSRPLHPALGGPYIVVFPVEDHHELTSFVPESGAFFFLKAVVVE